MSTEDSTNNDCSLVLGDNVLDGHRIESAVSSSSCNLDSEKNGDSCRVCHCFESDEAGDVALNFLGIVPPFQVSDRIDGDLDTIEFVGPGGEIFICKNDIEMGSRINRDTLIELGCSCKNDLSLVHYACALKWFVNHGSSVCEICGQIAKNIRAGDLKKVSVSLKEYEAMRERTASGDPYPASVTNVEDVDPDAVAAIRRQRLSEISSFFNPVVGTNLSAVAYPEIERSIASTTIAENATPYENATSKWAIEGTGILLAVGVLTATLAWLIAPRVGKKNSKGVLHVLLAGVCALTAVVFIRFVVLARIKYGPARYWAILFVFWFLIFGIWASRSHST